MDSVADRHDPPFCLEHDFLSKDKWRKEVNKRVCMHVCASQHWSICVVCVNRWDAQLTTREWDNAESNNRTGCQHRLAVECIQYTKTPFLGSLTNGANQSFPLTCTTRQGPTLDTQPQLDPLISSRTWLLCWRRAVKPLKQVATRSCGFSNMKQPRLCAFDLAIEYFQNYSSDPLQKQWILARVFYKEESKGRINRIFGRTSRFTWSIHCDFDGVRVSSILDGLGQNGYGDSEHFTCVNIQTKRNTNC